MKHKLFTFLGLFFLGLLFISNSSCGNKDASAKEEKIDISPIMMHHILDAHDWHITDIPGKWFGKDDTITIALHLPWFFYNRTEGKMEFFASTKAMEESNKYTVHHEHVYAKSKIEPTEIIHTEVTENHEEDIDKSVNLIDFSISKTSLQMILVAIFLIFLFIRIAKKYQQNPSSSPKGIQSVFEPIIVFVRDDIAKPNIGKKYEKFTPLLLTFFFFIWISNLLGLLPFNLNIMGNISVTVALAIITFIITQISASKDYWAHIFWFPGVSVPVKFLMLIVEFVGLFTKPFALTIRLFANIAAGHFMILGLVGLIFIIKYAAIPLTFVFVLFISTLELLVGIVQAYVFTLLSSIFIGSAMVSHHEPHEKGHH